MTDPDTTELDREATAAAEGGPRDAAAADPAATDPGAPPARRAPADADTVEVEQSEEAGPVEELDQETRERRDRALALVRKFGDPVLRATAVPVERFDDTLRREAQRMGELMHDALGIGLAATQLGVLHRLLVFKAYEDDDLTALVNPVIEWTSDELEAGDEGCLSLPGVHVEVERPARVRVKASDPSGASLEIEADGLRARVIQHEIDHLDGVLILDRISRQARKEAMRAMREALSAGGRAAEADTADTDTADTDAGDSDAGDAD